MSQYIVLNGGMMIGDGKYLDEVKEFAERLAEAPNPSWTDAGELYSNNCPTGWRIMKKVEEVAA